MTHDEQAQAPANLKAWRRDMRERLLEARVGAGGRQRKAWNEAIEARLRPLLFDLGREVVAFYWPYKGEYDCRALMRDVHGAGLQVVLPAVVAPRSPLEFRLWEPEAAMEPGVYKIPVPKARNLRSPQVLLVPVVGFDAEGYRLGYGGGYYDRTLAVLDTDPVVIGVGYEIARLDTVFPQPHDIAMHHVVTEASIHSFTGEVDAS